MTNRRTRRRKKTALRIAITLCSVAVAFLMGGMAAKTAASSTETASVDTFIEPERKAVEIGDFSVLNEEPTYRLETMTLTAYCPCEKCCGKWSYLDHAGTACGARAKEGVTVAMGPDVPFGTEIYIEGIGRRICQDRGSAITSGRIDVYFDNHDDALSFGMKTARVWIQED